MERTSGEGEVYVSPDAQHALLTSERQHCVPRWPPDWLRVNVKPGKDVLDWGERPGLGVRGPGLVNW